MRLREPSFTKRHDFLDLTALKSKPYLLFCIATFFNFMGIYVIFFYIELFALEKTDVNGNPASHLLSIINAASTIGRLIPNFFADKTGPLNIQIPFAFILAVLFFGWIGIKSTTGSIIFCLLYGLFCGSFVSLPGVTIMNLSPSLATIGIQLGMSFVIAGCGLLVGEPIAGAIDIARVWRFDRVASIVRRATGVIRLVFTCCEDTQGGNEMECKSLACCMSLVCILEEQKGKTF